MSRDHRTWETISAYFREIPIHQELIDAIRLQLDCNKRVLIMVLKEDPRLEFDSSRIAYTAKEKQEALCNLFSNELIQGKVLIVHVPDIQNFTRINL
jgi:hypothetical protein